jgi:hypothetical protein
VFDIVILFFSGLKNDSSLNKGGFLSIVNKAELIFSLISLICFLTWYFPIFLLGCIFLLAN